jgi:nicotinamide mononucleotide transporter
MNMLEITANGVIAASIVLAARNSLHTWWTGIIGCLLFAALFWSAQLYAEVVLQGFFVVTSVYGWWHWTRGPAGTERPIRSTNTAALIAAGAIAAAVGAGYGWLLHHFTDAFAPFADSAILAFSVLAQVLLMQRRVATWPFWLVVNTIAVPVYASRDLHLTAILYGAYWLNAWFGWWRWRREMTAAA